MDHELTTELLARLERLEDANRQLSAQVEQLSVRAVPEPDGAHDHTAAADSSPVGRRGLLKRVGAFAVGATALTAAGQVISAPSAAAADGQPLIMGSRLNESTSDTQYSLAQGTDRTAFIVFNTARAGGNRLTRAVYGGATDIGVQGVGDKRAGVLGLAGPGADGFQVDRAGVGGVGAQGAPGVLGISDSADGVLGRSNGTDAGVHGTCAHNSGYGVFGDGGTAGVAGFSSGNAGVKGFTDEGRGVFGYSPQAVVGESAGVHGVLIAPSDAGDPGANLGFAGVVGESRDYGGVKGASGGYIGVEGTSTNGDGVVGRSANYRGGVFTGGSAAVKLVPGTRATPPTTGETGDLYVDSTGRLWYCRQSGNNWVNLA